jgi:hypothetical protein
MIKHYEEERRYFLLKALNDAKKWCVAEDEYVEGSHSDQFWLRLFSSSSGLVTSYNAHRFLAGFQLAKRFFKWDEDSVATRINDFRKQHVRDIRVAVRTLAEDLREYTTNKTNQTSAASKIAFFSKPLQEVYIWDQYARKSARFRECIRTGIEFGFVHINRAYKIQNGAPDYASFSFSCGKALEEERRRSDFVAAVKDFRDFIERVGGPMADPGIIESSFMERRFLDKLMFWEGRWVRGLSGNTERASGNKDEPEKCKFNKSSDRRESVVSETRMGRKAARGSGSLKERNSSKEKWDGYIRLHGISEFGNTKQAQALRLFLNGTTEAEYKKALPGYSKSFNVMLTFFIDNGYISSVVNGKTFLRKSK